MEEGVGISGPRFRTWLARIRLSVPAPLDLSGLRIERFEETSNIRDVAGDSDDHMIADDERGHGRKVAEFGIGKLDDPANGAILGVETNHV